MVVDEEEEEKKQLEMKKREELKELARRVPLPPLAPEEEEYKAVGAVVERNAAAVPAEQKKDEEEQQQQPVVDEVPAAQTHAVTPTAEHSDAPSEEAAAAAADVVVDTPIQADEAPATAPTRAPSPEPEPRVERCQKQEHRDEPSPEVASNDHFIGAATEEEESAPQPRAEEPPLTAEPAHADIVHSGDHAPEAEAAQHDVEESVGMDSDYLVESQGTEPDAAADERDEGEPERHIEQIDLALPVSHDAR